MIHFIRDKHNRTIVDIEAMSDDIICSIDIINFTNFLLQHALQEEQEYLFANDIHSISEIRGTYFEQASATMTTDELAERECKHIAVIWGLYYVTD